jgi:thioredoxin-related protein
MRLILSAAVIGLLATTAPAFAGDDAAEGESKIWYADYDKAVEAAKAQNKNLFVDFTGSDWCSWCIKLHEEVFAHPEFLEPIRKSFVLVALDFPRGEEAKSKVPNPERNAALQQKYDVRGFPTILLITPEGEVFGRTGYRAGGAVKYMEHLDSAAKDWKAANEMAAAWAKADASAKEDLMAKACEAMVKFESSMASEKVKDIVMAAFAADPENKRGLRLKAAGALLKTGMADATVSAEGKKLDPKNDLGLLELVIQNQFQSVRDQVTAEAAVAALAELDGKTFKDKEIGFRLYFTAARWCAGPLKNNENAVKFAELAIAVGSDEQAQIDFLKQLIEKSKPTEAEEGEDEPAEDEAAEEEDEGEDDEEEPETPEES